MGVGRAADPEHLLRYRIPDARTCYGPRDCALYALSLGLGQDPLDERALAFVGGSDDVVPFPTLALVLGHPGFWMARPDTGLHAQHAIHYTQSLEILQPLRASGTVVGKTRMLGLVDRGAARGALLYAERQLLTETGTVLARMVEGILLRRDGGFGRSTMSPLPLPSLPRTPSDWRLEIVTRPEQALYYRWNGDANPLHRSPAAARAAGFERPILQGLCTFGMAARAVVQTALGWHADRLRTLSGRFVRPVVPGDLLCAHVWREGQFQIVRVADGKTVLDGGQFSVVGP